MTFRTVASVDGEEDHELLRETPPPKRRKRWRSAGDLCLEKLKMQSVPRIICFAASFTFVLVIFIWGAFFISSDISLMSTEPSDWDVAQWNLLLKTKSPGFCSLPIRMLRHPFVGKRTVLVAPLGNGGMEILYRVRDAARLAVAVETCELGVEFSRATNIRSAAFRGECSSPMMYTHHILVLFTTVHQPLLDEMEATRVVGLMRNPFVAIESAYDELMDCDGVGSMDCVLARRHRSKLYSNQELVWDSFVRAHAQEIGDHMRQFSNQDQKIQTIEYETFDLETTLRMIFPSSLPLPTMCFPSPPTNTSSMKLGISKKFTPELRRAVCSATQDVWRQDLWGPCV
jgi:hypothetical protein